MSQLTFAHPCSQTSPSALSLLAGAQSRRRALRTVEGPVHWSIDLEQRGHCSQIKKLLWAVVRRARLRWPLQVPQTDPSVQRAAKQTEVAADPMFDLNYHTAKGKILLLDVLFLCFWRGGAGGDYPRWILHEWRDKRAALIPSLSTASTEQMNLKITIGHWINSPNGNWCDFSRGTVTGTVLAGSPVGVDVNFHWQRWRSQTVLGRFACYASTLECLWRVCEPPASSRSTS